MNQEDLLDDNLYKVISRCYINHIHPDMSEIFVIYTDGDREKIWTFDPLRHDYDRKEFIGKTKIAAVFHCDRKCSRNM